MGRAPMGELTLRRVAATRVVEILTQVSDGPRRRRMITGTIARILTRHVRVTLMFSGLRSR
jgi:hypothetical protein